MSVKKEASGRRSVQVEVEVPGTAEEVWQAIATGPGVSSWFVPAELDERAGGTITCHFGPGMDSSATITEWDPPRRLAAESRDLGPNAPTLATEWIVEARSGGTCIVRVVHSLFASTDDWDNQLESTESGWPAFFLILRLYLTHFRGQPCSTFQVAGFAPGPESKAWDALTGALGLSGVKLDQRRTTSAGARPLTGVVTAIREDRHPYAMLLLDEPAPGAAFLNTCGMGTQVFLAIGFYFYGDRASATAARDEPLWRAWMSEHFPAVTSTSNTG